MILLALIPLLTYVEGAGDTKPSFYQSLTFTFTYGGIDNAGYTSNTQAIKDGIRNSFTTPTTDEYVTVSQSHPDITVNIDNAVSWAEAQALITEISGEGNTFCSDVQTAVTVNGGVSGFTSGADCISAVSYSAKPYYEKYPVVTFTYTYENVTNAEGVSAQSDIDTAVAAGLTGVAASDLTTVSHSGLAVSYSFTLTTYSDADAAVAELNGAGFCAAVEAAISDPSLVYLQSATSCISSATYTIPTFEEGLVDACTVEGEYAVTGTSIGKSVILDYENSTVTFETANVNRSLLTLEFFVPSMYFYVDQTVNNPDSSKNYNRSVAVTFHDRSTQPMKYDQCYTTKPDYVNCPDIVEDWKHQDLAGDSCSQRLVGILDFRKLLYDGYMDEDNILVLNDTENGQSRLYNGFATPTWELYMTAFVETWAGVFAQSDLEGVGNLTFNNPTSENQRDWSDHLVLNEERYSWYYIPFRISWPQQITIVAQEITSFAQMLILYAVIEQQIYEINFDPQSLEEFGIMDLTVKTQTQWPFGLRNHTDPVAPALVKIVSGEAESIEFIQHGTHYSQCQNDGVTEFQYCEQEWYLRITPQLCDISGSYTLEFWAECFDQTECPLDNDAWNPTYATKLTSNAYSGLLDFSIQAQEFCPQVLDEVYVKGYIEKYINWDFTEVAVPGTNLFSNDHVYFEVTFRTASLKTNQEDTVNTPAGVDTVIESRDDDSLIDFVRAYHIELDVTLTQTPLQVTVPMNTAGCSGSIAAEGCDIQGGTSTVYKIVLCDVPAATFPFTSALDNCFDRSSYGWNALDYLAFTRWNETAGANSIDTNEIAFSIRLDERTIPVDIPNSPVDLTLKVDAEVFYHGTDTSPDSSVGRRTLTQKMSRRNLQGDVPELDRMEGAQVLDRFTYTKRPEIASCDSVLTSNVQWTGFELDILLEPMEIPTTMSAPAAVVDMKYAIAKEFGVSFSELEIYRVDSCAGESCQQVFPRTFNRRFLQDDRYARYYLDIKDSLAARKFQLAMQDNSHPAHSEGFLAGKGLVGMRVDHCNEDLMEVMTELRKGDVDEDVTTEDELESSASILLCFMSLIVALFY